MFDFSYKRFKLIFLEVVVDFFTTEDYSRNLHIPSYTIYYIRWGVVVCMLNLSIFLPTFSFRVHRNCRVLRVRCCNSTRHSSAY